MSEKEKIQFNRMHEALRKIAKDYQTPEQLRPNHKEQYGYGLSFEEIIEMSYHNIQNDAKHAIKGIRKRIIN